MRKKFVIVSVLLSLLLTINPILAKSSQEKDASSHERIKKTLKLPPHQEDETIIPLGLSRDPQGGEIIEGYAIIHRKENNQKTGNARVRKTQCYGYLATGAKWKNLEPWVLNADNTQGLDPISIFNNFSNNMTKWEDASDGIVGNGFGVNILGDGVLTTANLIADNAAPDGSNEVYFADVDDPGAIAVTIVWGIFGGPTFQRKLVEWDQIYDDFDYSWSLSGEPGKMDFENIATHELGHSVGMGDLYNACTDETMYGYASFGETKKRDLNTGDISGINQLY